jgi:hypothetical protein
VTSLDENGLRDKVTKLSYFLNELFIIRDFEMTHNLHAIESIAEITNIIPAYKILTLRPLVKSLQGWLDLSEDDLFNQAAQELSTQLQQKVPESYKADFEKLALAVFPQDVAGRLRAAGFGTQQQA